MRRMIDLRKVKYKINPTFSSENIVLKRQSITEQLTYEYSTAIGDASPSLCRRDEVALLLNEERVSKLSPSTIDLYLKELGYPRESSAFSGMSDEDLIRYIKSRHIQTPSELMAYSKLLLATHEDIADQVKQVVEEYKSQESTETTTENNA